jgi:hypothetical protein
MMLTDADLVDLITAEMDVVINYQQAAADKAVESGTVSEANREMLRLSGMTQVKAAVIQAVIKHSTMKLQEMER